MSRIETLKTQFPQLDISLLDVLSYMDGTKSHKYLQMLCKIFSNQHTFNRTTISDYDGYKKDVVSSLEMYNVKLNENDSINYVVYRLLENFFRKDEVQIFNRFREYNERGLVEENDITKYSDFSQIRGQVSLCEMKVLNKELESQVHKEFEDDTWVLIRPLSFQASARYGSSTRWCTTYNNEKQYFFKYFYNGSLVYFINKTNGYKAAMHGIPSEKNGRLFDISFWNAEDARCDYFDLQFDDYLSSTIKRIISDNRSNSSFLDKEKLFEVAIDCGSAHKLEEYGSSQLVRVGIDTVGEVVPDPPLQFHGLMPREYHEGPREVQAMPEMVIVPNMRA